MTQISTWLKFALQQMAAESYLDRTGDLTEILTDGNNDRRVIPVDQFSGKTRFTDLQAQQFTQDYQILDHHARPGEGLRPVLSVLPLLRCLYRKERSMNNRHVLFGLVTTISLVLTLGVSMSAYASTTFTWKEEVLLHDDSKIIVERSDIYDSSMNHEIGQGAPLAEHKTTFMIPGTNQTVIWKSDNRSSLDPDNLNLLALDFINGIPIVATLPSRCISYNKWNRPNPPYVFFKYLDGWKRISLEEFPEKFKINLVVPSRKKDEPKLFEADQKFGFVPAQTVAEINKEPGRSKESYAIFRMPFIAGNSATVDCPPIYSGFKAPNPITPPNTVKDKK